MRTVLSELVVHRSTNLPKVRVFSESLCCQLIHVGDRHLYSTVEPITGDTTVNYAIMRVCCREVALYQISRLFCVQGQSERRLQ